MKKCFEDQVRDQLKFSPEVTKAFTKAALEHLNSGKDYVEAIDAISTKTGLQRATVARIIVNPQRKLFSITKQAWAKQARAENLRKAATQIVYKAGQSKTLKAALAVYEFERRAELFAHAGVYPWTHTRDYLLTNPILFLRNVRRTWSYRSRLEGTALHEMDMALLHLSDHYDFWHRAGLQIGDDAPLAEEGLNPAEGHPVLSKIKMLKKRFLGAVSWSQKAFDSLKIFRYEVAEQLWSRLPDDLKTEGMAQRIARDINYFTSTIRHPVGEAAEPIDRFIAGASQWAGASRALLASKMWFGKQAANVVTPIRWMKPAKTLEERVANNMAMKRWAQIASFSLGLLGANWAANKLMGVPDKDNVNLQNPYNGQTFLRGRIGRVVLPTSMLLETIRQPIMAIAAAWRSRSVGEFFSREGRNIWYSFHPTIRRVGEQITGREDFSGRPVPSMHNLVEPVHHPQKPPMTLSEYMLKNNVPIPAQSIIEQYYNALRDEGVDKGMANRFIIGTLNAAAAGLAGQHLSEVDESSQQRRRRRHRHREEY